MNVNRFLRCLSLTFIAATVISLTASPMLGQETSEMPQDSAEVVRARLNYVDMHECIDSAFQYNNMKLLCLLHLDEPAKFSPFNNTKWMVVHIDGVLVKHMQDNHDVSMNLRVKYSRREGKVDESQTGRREWWWCSYPRLVQSPWYIVRVAGVER